MLQKGLKEHVIVLASFSSVIRFCILNWFYWQLSICFVKAVHLMLFMKVCMGSCIIQRQ